MTANNFLIYAAILLSIDFGKNYEINPIIAGNPGKDSPAFLPNPLPGSFPRPFRAPS
jgi:hypothetical protein